MKKAQKSSIDAALIEVMELIALLTHPKRMSKEQYRDFLAQLMDDLKPMWEAVMEELGDDDE